MSAVSKHHDLSEEDVFDIFSNQRRRYVFYILREQDEQEVSVQELTVRIAEMQTGESPPPQADQKRVYTALHQVHLPKLEDAGIIDYDTDTGTVRLTNKLEGFGIRIEVYNEGTHWTQPVTLLLGAILIAGGYIGLTGSIPAGPALFAVIFIIVSLMSLLAGYLYKQISINKRSLYQQEVPNSEQ